MATKRPDPIVLECRLCFAEAEAEQTRDWVVDSKGRWVCGQCDQSWRQEPERDGFDGSIGHRRCAARNYHGEGYDEA